MPEAALVVFVLCLIGAVAAFVVIPRLVPSTPRSETLSKKDRAKSQRYIITYKDANNEVSTREITVKRVIVKKNQVLVRAICHLRNGDRTFIVNNIIDMRESQTGKPIDAAPFFYAKVDPDLRPCVVTEAAFEKARPLLVPLKWVANADGEITTEELEVLVRFCRRLSGQQEQLDLSQLAGHVATLKTTLSDSKNSLDPQTISVDQGKMVQEAISELVVLGGEQSRKRAKRLTTTT